MKVTINRLRCKQCGLCIANCPKQAIRFTEEMNEAGYRPVQIDDTLCIGCGMCYITCPDGVYHVVG